MSRFPTHSLALALSLAAACQARTSQEHTSPDAPAGHSAAEVARYVRVAPSDAREMARFESDKELKAYIADMLRRQRRERAANSGLLGAAQGAFADSASTTAAPSPPAAEASKAADGDDKAGGADEAITNTQEAGVDEGGIVKAHGDYLIVLRRGRLFSIRVTEGKARAVSMVDVTPPGKSHDAWYDEMLVSGNRIVVVGFSYEAGATELGLFDIDDAGRIRYRATHFLRSNDYYSSRNYASRLLGDKLVFYMPYALVDYNEQISMPGVRKLGSKRDSWRSIITAAHIFKPIQQADWPILHTVVTCDLGAPELECKAQGIVGPYGRTFYVSEKAVYVWVQNGYGEQASGVVYRLPLGDEGPGALRVKGAPVDQFSFKEDDGGHLNVLVRAENNGGDWMWGPEATAGDVAMMRVPVEAFSTRVATVRETAYTELPKPSRGYSMQNRFVGAYVLYGTGSSWGYAETERDDRVFVYPYAGGAPFKLNLVHGVDRIEAMGEGAVVIGTDGQDLHFTSIDLERQQVADRYRQKQASQGELRSHGFFYKPMGEDKGVLGLPVSSEGRAGYEHLIHGSAQVLFLDVDRLAFKRLGALESGGDQADDACRVSCVDWYGNARPIFYRGRVFALMGYELVEGKIADGRMREVGRTTFLMKRRLQAAAAE